MTARSVVVEWWGRLAHREQRMLLLMAAVVALAVLWFVGIAPALRTVRSAPGQLDVLEAQWQSMQSLAAQARAMQSRPALGRDDALRELELSARQRLGGGAQISVAGDRVTVLLKDAPPQSIAPWLSQVRLKARVVATQANLTRTPLGWDGTLVFNLPASP